MVETMPVTYPISPKEDINKNLDVFAAKVISAFYSLLKITVKLAGVIGLTLLSILLLLFIPFLYLYMVRTNKVLRKRLRVVYDWINTADDSDLRYIHLEVEKRNTFFKKLLEKKKIIDKNIITMGISSQTNQLIQQVFDLENTLYKAAYPEIDRELTADDVEELKAIYSGKPFHSLESS